MNSLLEHYRKVCRVSLGQLQLAGLTPAAGGWSLNYKEAWRYLRQLEDSQKVALWRRLLRKEAVENGLESIQSRLTICGWPIYAFGEGPTTFAVRGSNIDRLT